MLMSCIYPSSGSAQCGAPAAPSRQYCLEHLRQLTHANVQISVLRLIEEQLGVEPHRIALDSALVDDLGADSLDAVEIVIAVEAIFEIELSDAVIERARTPLDLVSIVAEMLLAEERFVLAPMFDFEKIRRELTQNASKAARVAERVTASTLFHDFLRRLRVDEEVFRRFFHRAVRNAWIDHVTTVQVSDRNGQLEAVHIYLLTPAAILAFRVRRDGIHFDSFALHSIHLSYDVRMANDGRIASIEVRPSLPSHWKVESPSLSFFNDIGIDGALAFLTKVLRNQERLRAS